MRERALVERDIPVLRAWHEQSGFDYPFPDLFAGAFASVVVIVDENDRPVLAIPAKKTVEMYLLMDATWKTPRWRLEALIVGHEAMRRELEKQGFEDVNCWLPPEIERSFGKRLIKLFRWSKSRWKSYSRRVKDV